MNEILKKTTLFPSNTISEGMEKLDLYGLQIIILIDKEFNLIGTVTDGDIRKGLMKGIKLSNKIIKVANLKPKFVNENTSKDEIMRIFQNFNFRAIPIIDDSKKLKNCYFINDFVKIDNKSSNILIMAGGYGKRLGNLTKDCPKPMLKINKKPILHHIIEKAVKENFNNIFISVHYKHEVIQNYFGDGKKFNANIKYIIENEQLGTGGSLRLMPEIEEPFVVINGDILTKLKFRDILNFHNATASDITMCVFNYEIQNPFGVVKTDGFKLVKFEEKPLWTTKVNAGIYVVHNSVKKFINKEENISLPSIIKRMNDKNKKCSVYTMSDIWIDIGTEKQLQKAKALAKTITSEM